MTADAAPYARPDKSYDTLTIGFHWLTAAIVVAQFSFAQIWGFLEKGTTLRSDLIYTHVALGISFSAVLALRILWRLFGGLRRPVQLPTMNRIAADAAPYLLYLLLISQVTLGFLLGWSAGNPLHFYDFFTIAPLFVVPREWRHTVGELHDYVAWAVIVLAFLHAAVALMHHHFFKDNVLRSMTGRASQKPV